MTEEQKTKFQKWYERNRDDFNKKRRSRYKKDDQYRDRVREYSRQYREANKQPPKEGPREVPKAVVEMEVHGATRKLHRIGEVATKLGVSTDTIRYLEKWGYIPRPKPIHNAITRWYGDHQVDLVEQALILHDRVKKRAVSRLELTAIIRRIKENWEKWPSQ